jgi:GNAT superfamily N-acetyltransferase
MTRESQFELASADKTLITQGDVIERLALRSLHAAATPDLRRALGLDWCERQSITASVAAGLPQSAIVVNRAFLTGDADLSTAAAPYRAAGVARFFLHMPHGTSSPAEPGFKEARAWQKFVRCQDAALPDAPLLDIERVTPGSGAEAAARIVCAAFDLGAAAEPWLARLCQDPRWRIFLVRIDGVPAGTGALFVSHDAGWCDWGATAPAFRGRGVQRALLRERLVVADALGLARVHTCTGAPAPGDPQHSYRNILRSGFAETILRRNFAPV